MGWTHGDLQHEMPQVRADPDAQRDMQIVRGLGAQSTDSLHPIAISVNETDSPTLRAHIIA